jgi:hypothetical protein
MPNAGMNHEWFTERRRSDTAKREFCISWQILDAIRHLIIEHFVRFTCTFGSRAAVGF